MGMFDTIRVEIQLPDHSYITDELFQTKSLDCIMETYVISSTGELYKEKWKYETIETPNGTLPFELKKIPGTYRRQYLTEFTGDIIFYGQSNVDDLFWRDYIASIENGRLTKLSYTDREVTINNNE